MSFDGQVAIVTGGASGIGKETARVFAQKGAAVAIIDYAGDAAINAAFEVSKDTGNDQIMGIKADVAQSKEVVAMVDEVVKSYGRIDFLVNSAAIRAAGNVLTLDKEVWDQVMQVNLKGMFLTSRYCLPKMIEGGGGSIVHISSVQSFASQKNVVAYTASKGGINALTRAMAVDHAADHIRVNAVCPGTTYTPAVIKSAGRFEGEKTLEEWGKANPVGRLGESLEIAHLVVFLCSREASFMTGGVYTADGGLLAKLPCELPENN
ncbi:SDR family NAD(P)-dependent oxidoreductase [Ammoniphilus resinae]|uniref:NAD(P)-dependent dehydrogenase (Short-subunit alcohol dehydrogenase family) n=1 Tax=Ammoniphilus resinae TaxID=861532 RepID=A0ABS4GSZ4_9BACL|nr:SDR family oxidoreductase [Ammoniphilus resinae]MBP1933354.1 NAD(P)-dependent dehydrogenase (short-subunit alcohol dehydrogenase family) [Ammoniphilus resinae]